MHKNGNSIRLTSSHKAKRQGKNKENWYNYPGRE